MRIIPVVDLKQGQVVRGVAGQRDAYRPVESRLCNDARPESVARAFVQQLGFRELYVADLDALAGASPAWPDYETLATLGAALLIDAGLATADQAQRHETLFAQLVSAPEAACRHRWIAALESSSSPAALAEVSGVVGAERLVFSLDLRHGQPWTTAAAWANMSGESIVDAAVGLGIASLIVLDVAAVGMGRGPQTLELCRLIRRRHPKLEIISGGGVRHRDDLNRLADAGCDAALVASALHDGTLR